MTAFYLIKAKDCYTDEGVEYITNQYRRIIRHWILKLFDADVDHELPVSNILTDLGVEFDWSIEQGNVLNPVREYFKPISCIHHDKEHMFKYRIQPRDFVVINTIDDSYCEWITQALKPKIDELNDIWETQLKNKRDRDWLGGSDYEVSPINGATTIYHAKRVWDRRNKRHIAPQWYAGHAHTLYQFFAPNILKQALHNVHYLNSSLNDVPIDFMDLLSRHLGIDLVEIDMEKGKPQND